MMNKIKDVEELKFQILSIDIGARTQDILLYNGSYETVFKMILPSPTLIMANRVMNLTKKGCDILITGETMGGGAFNHALYRHISRGNNVFMTELAARTVRDDLKVVESRGIKIVNEEKAAELINKGTSQIEAMDVNRKHLESIFEHFGFELKFKVIAIGVEDHGVAHNGESDRVCRISHFRNNIPASIEDFGFVEPPSFYSRMKGVKRTLNADFPNAKHIIMDSKIAAIFGGFFASGQKSCIVVDIGNGHIMCGSFNNCKLTGVFEHHSKGLTMEKIENNIIKFSKGMLTNKEVFDDGGHGCYISEPIGDVPVFATGPQRKDLANGESALSISNLDPYGDTMITGNVGLVECVKKKFEL